MKLAAALEKKSEHSPLPRPSWRVADEMGIVARTVEDFEAIPGRGGVRAREGESTIAAGNAQLMEDLDISVPHETREAFAREGKTPLFFARNGRLAGTIAVADEVKPTSAAAIKALGALGVKTVMLTGRQPPHRRGYRTARGRDACGCRRDGPLTRNARDARAAGSRRDRGHGW